MALHTTFGHVSSRRQTTISTASIDINTGCHQRPVSPDAFNPGIRMVMSLGDWVMISTRLSVMLTSPERSSQWRYRKVMKPEIPKTQQHLWNLMNRAIWVLEVLH